VEPRAFRVPDCCCGCVAVLDIVCGAGVVRRRVTDLTRVHRIPTDYRDGFASSMLLDIRRGCLKQIQTGAHFRTVAQGMRDGRDVFGHRLFCASQFAALVCYGG
jgi:hypothetical protein